jgi:transcriptional regulator
MYLPSHFEMTDPAALHELVRAHPLATWVTQRDGDLVAEHVPFLLDAGRGPHGTLVGHVARANPVWQHEGPSLVVFQGPQAYVSPGWYPSKREHGKVVPTWNYAVVHVHGRARAVEEPAALLEIVTRLTRSRESGRTAPWAVSDAPPDFVSKTLEAIVGIEIEIERIAGKWKMSQNRSEADRRGVVEGLNAEGGEEALAVAALVRAKEQA